MATSVRRTEIEQLVTMGKTHGYLTWDQVNDALPPGIVSPEEIDNIFVIFQQLHIEVLRLALYCRDEGDVYLGLLSRGELDLGLLGRLVEALQ